jgi:hypothetical protein
MKKIFTLALLCLVTHWGFAQWTDNGSTIETSDDVIVDGRVTISNGQFYQSYRNDGTTEHQAFGMDTNNDIIFNRSAIVNKFSSRLIFGFANRSIDFRNKDNVTLMTINNDGNVGIGTTNPGSFKLAVEGPVASREVQVTNTSPFPDYVFAPSYELPTLQYIEDYIKANQHLPEIPSAKEVEEQGGIKLGEMNIKLLKKIEELTLYVIDQNKKTEELTKRLEKLEAENNTLKEELKRK